jgi:hypothetical protein
LSLRHVVAILRARAPFAFTVVLVDLTLYDAYQLAFFFRSARYPDFRLFWGAARLVLANGPGAVYGTLAGAPWPYLNPPLLAWLLVPLAAMPFELAFGLWFVASAVALAWAARLCEVGWRGVLSAFALLPVFLALGTGQVAPLLLLAVVWAVRLDARGRWAAAGLLYALLAVKPQMGLLLPVALLAAGRWRTVAMAAAAGVAIAALTVAALGVDGLRAWLAAVSDFSFNPYFLRWSLVPLVGGAGWWVALLVVAALVAAGARRWSADPLVVTGIGLTGSLLVNHYLTPPDFVMLLLPAWALVRIGGPAALLGGMLWLGGWLSLWLPEVTIATEALVVALAIPLARVVLGRRLAPAFQTVGRDSKALPPALK